MDYYLASILKVLMLPPGIFILLFFISIFLFKNNRKKSIVLHATVLTLFIILTMPIASMMLMSIVEKYPALTYSKIKISSAQAIVVLGAGRNRNAKEFGGGHTVSQLTFERLRYGVYLHKLTKLPILVSGEAQLMEFVLINEFNINGPILLDDKSLTTSTNAKYSKIILDKYKMSKIFLVTHATHMRRAVYSFETMGLIVTPAPTIFFGLGHEPIGIKDFFPDAYAFQRSSIALHEILGLLWYVL